MQRTSSFVSFVHLLSLALWLTAAPALAGTVSPAGPELRVNGTAPGEQRQAAVAAAPDGSFLVAWLTPSPISLPALEARLFDAGGAPLSGRIRIASAISTPPRVVAAAGGGFAVAWTEQELGVRLRLLDENGQPAGGVGGFLTGAITCCLDLAALPDGGFVAAWIGAVELPITPIGELTGVQARRFDSLGRPAGDVLDVLDIDPGSRRSPRVAADAQGGFAVTWEEDRGTSSLSWVRRFDAADAPLGPPVQVPPAGQPLQLGPVPVFGGAGALSVAWAEWRPDGGVRDGCTCRRWMPPRRTRESGSSSRWSSREA